MIIQRSPKLDAFFKRCIYNMTHDTKNEFLGLRVTVDNERTVQKMMQKARFHEFMGPESTWPSLLISTQSFMQSPYHSTINLDSIRSDEFHLSKETLPSSELFNVASIQKDPMGELNDSMVLRALDQPYQASVLRQGSEVWMLDVPSEANTIDPYAQKAFGKVLSYGLGIGYFVFMACLNPKVTSITVVEHSQSVIDLFNTYLRPQFSTHIPITVIQGDAFDYFNASTLKAYDYAFVDIWQSSIDGLERIEALLESYLPPHDSVDFWIEDSCYEIVSALMLRYFESTAFRRVLKHPDPRLQNLLKKIEMYFAKIDKVITDEVELKYYMHDTQTLRTILAQKL